MDYVNPPSQEGEGNTSNHDMDKSAYPGEGSDNKNAAKDSEKSWSLCADTEHLQFDNVRQNVETN